MPQAAPTGLFKQAYRLKLLVAASTTFQSVVKASNETEARDHVYLPDASPEDCRPLAIIKDEDEPIAYEKEGNGFYRVSDGSSLTLSFQFVIPPKYSDDRTQSNDWFMTQMEGIAKNMLDNSGQGEPVTGETHLNVIRLDKVAGPFEIDSSEFRLPDPEDGEHFQTLYHIEFRAHYF